VLITRPLRRHRDPSEPHPAPLSCIDSESALHQEEYVQLCGPARKYGTPWLYALLCRWCMVRKVTEEEGGGLCAICQCPTAFSFSPLRHVLVGVALLAFYLGVGVAGGRVTMHLTRARFAPGVAPVAAARAAKADDGESAQTRQRVAEKLQAAQALRAAGKVDEARLAFKDAIALDASSVAAQTGLAECAYELGSYPEAEQAIGEVLKLDANSLPALLTLARIKGAAGKVDAATQHAQKALDLEPGNVEAMLLLSQCHLAAGRLDEAAAQAQAAITQDPRNPGGSLALANAELLRQNLAGAEAGYRRALELDPNLLIASIGLARIQRLRGDFNAAIATLDKILARTPDATDASVELAEVHVARGKLSVAIGVLRNLCEKQPRFYLGRARLAELLVHSGKTNAGYLVARDLLADDPGSIRAHLLLADVFLRNGFPSLTAEHCRAVLAQNAGLVLAIKLLTRACLATQEYQDGSVAIRRLVEERPTDLEAKIMLAYCYEGMGTKDTSIELLEAAATALPTSPTPLVEMGTIYRLRGDQAAAAAAYERALLRAPDDPIALSNCAALILDSGGPKERALELALKAAERLPGSPAVADTLGWAYCQTGNFGKGLECLIYAAMQVRDNPTVRYHLAVALYGKGDAAKAVDQLQQALAVDQEFAAAPQAEALLQKIRAELKATPAPLRADPK
jgi:tetratricopeptide (TPR) repeat protein